MAEKNYGNNSQLAELMKYISDTMKFPILGAGGGFAPIGARGYFEGQTAPQGWLICDGSVKNIADYPDLATYIASQQGSVNYYGGDGTTTFGLPTMNGMPNGGVATPDEHIVGEWREIVDGVLKKKPRYKKKVVFPAGSNDSGDLSSLNIENYCIDTQSTYIRRDNGEVACVAYINTDSLAYSCSFIFNSGHLYVNVKNFQIGQVVATISYTKTTDSWQTVQEGHSSDGNGVFCVKATVAGDPNGHVYSTEEQVVGQWIDGSDIYEKTISCGAMPNATTKQVVHNISGLKNVVEFNGYATDGTKFVSLPYTSYDGKNNISIYVNATNIVIITNTNLSIYATSYITIRYTKTTD